MRKRNLSILSWNEMDRRRLWKFINLIIGLLSFSLIGGFSCEKQKESDSKSKTNSPPVITLVKILPEKPYKESELNVNIQGQDPDGDPVIYRYQWIRNDEEVVGKTNNSFKSGIFKKRDLVRVKVTPSDGKVDGKPFLSAPVKIVNSPPSIKEVWIEPKVAYANDQLKAYIKASDADGDFIYFTYKWENIGIVLTEEKGEVLEPGRYKKGDLVTVTVTPNDRETSGTPKKSDPIIILNSSPNIISSPPTSIKGNTYIYQVKANDPDQDPIIFTLKSGPKGMEIDKNSGLIRWEIQKEDKGSHSIEIEASDNAGARTVQIYTLAVEFR